MQDAAAGGRGSGTVTPAGAAPGEMEAGLQMDDAGVLREAGAPAGADEAELEEEEEAELEAAAGGVNCPLLSEPELSRAGEDFFLAGRLLAPPPLCCCCRHLARRFLNQTWSEKMVCRGMRSGARRGSGASEGPKALPLVPPPLLTAGAPNQPHPGTSSPSTHAQPLAPHTPAHRQKTCPAWHPGHPASHPKQGCPGPVAGVSQLVHVPGAVTKHGFGGQILRGVLHAYPTPLGIIIWGAVPEGAPLGNPQIVGLLCPGAGGKGQKNINKNKINKRG